MTNETLKELGFKNISYLRNPGIYVLLLKGKVVYVGQTISMLDVGRLGKVDHRGRDYDEVYFVKCNIDELDRLEALMILKLKPESGKAFNFNKDAPPSAPGQSVHTVTVKGMQFSLVGRRRV